VTEFCDVHDLASLYPSITRRDPALDGIVFVAVVTTGIYCRPVCKARVPLAKNMRLFPTAAAAEHDGYRPCLRCRPETAPASPAWKGTRTTVDRALGLIESGLLDSENVERLAERLGVGARHLARLFAEHVGAPPQQVAKTMRIQRAKRLLDAAELSLAAIASRAGFRSARRMRFAFVEFYGCTPAEFRRRKRLSTAPQEAKP
jgi:AraC family transcriptional regulator, regulatory protein of adaptative response / methylated-DNA-[protein]-cysteine methyltransferase